MTHAGEDDYESLPNSSMSVNMMAGALAGITEHCIMYPVDSIKTRMQVLQTGTLYSSLSAAFSRVASSEGAVSLWRGVTSMVLGAGPSHALYFATYEQCKVLFGADGDDHAHLATGNHSILSISYILCRIWNRFWFISSFFFLNSCRRCLRYHCRRWSDEPFWCHQATHATAFQHVQECHWCCCPDLPPGRFFCLLCLVPHHPCHVCALPVPAFHGVWVL